MSGENKEYKYLLRDRWHELIPIILLNVGSSVLKFFVAYFKNKSKFREVETVKILVNKNEKFKVLCFWKV